MPRTLVPSDMTEVANCRLDAAYAIAARTQELECDAVTSQARLPYERRTAEALRGSLAASLSALEELRAWMTLAKTRGTPDHALLKRAERIRAALLKDADPMYPKDAQ